MSALTRKPPESVRIDGKEYMLRSDFRNVLRIMESFIDNELNAQEKTFVMLCLLFKDNVPKDIEKAVRFALRFINCGEEILDNEEPNKSVERLYSFTKDAQYIYSGILQTHGIDIHNLDHLHWWQFVWMFMDLSEHTYFSQLISLRSRARTGKLLKEEKEFISKNPDILCVEGDAFPPEAQAEINKFYSLLEGKGQ